MAKGKSVERSLRCGQSSASLNRRAAAARCLLAAVLACGLMMPNAGLLAYGEEPADQVSVQAIAQAEGSADLAAEAGAENVDASSGGQGENNATGGGF